jgi:hypothetical protein
MGYTWDPIDRRLVWRPPRWWLRLWARLTWSDPDDR